MELFSTEISHVKGEEAKARPHETLINENFKIHKKTIF